MDHSKQPTREQIQQARIIVVAAIESVSDCFWPDIVKAADNRVHEALAALVQEGER